MNQMADRKDFTRNREIYDRFWSQRWRRYWTYSNQGKLKRFQRLLRSNGLFQKKNLRVFDMGFGMGSMLFSFHPSCRLAGTELSPSAVKEAKAAADRLGYVEADFRTYEPGMAYPSAWRGCFDVVISSHVLEHIEKPEPALRELVELLKPGGHACIIVPINEKPGDDLNHFHLFTERSFRDLLVEAGLKLVEVESCDRILNLVRPLIRRIQAGPSAFDRLESVLFNAVFGFAPLSLLRFADFRLLPKRWPFCQCLALAQKTPENPNIS